ncbi:Ig-like domain-containing protein [Cohnella soli]|uniref:Ig-like domain-containing protein n=1 Tax=Cohnella soli TaxID=425005 RepID=A0ABW0HZ14_9BACL
MAKLVKRLLPVMVSAMIMCSLIPAGFAAANEPGQPDRNAFPIGIYIPPPPEDVNQGTYEDIADMNVNFIIGGNSHYTFDVNDRALGFAAANGLKMLVTDEHFVVNHPVISQNEGGDTAVVTRTHSWGQTFTTPETGSNWSINIVELNADKANWPQNATLTLRLYKSPSKTQLLAMKTFNSPSEHPDFALGVAVQTNTSYYLELTSNGNSGVALTTSHSDAYAGGQAYDNGTALAGKDMWFNISYVSPVYEHGDKPSESGLADVVDHYKDNPAVMGYTLKDEPPANMLTLVDDTVKTLKELDPARPSFVNLFPSEAGSTLNLSNDATGEYVSSETPLGQTFTTSADQTTVKTVQWFVNKGSWQAGENLTVTLWDSPNKNIAIARSTLEAAANDWPVFTLNAAVEPHRRYYMELTHNGQGDDKIGQVVRSGTNKKWYNGGNAYINGQAINADFWFTINQNIEAYTYEDYVYRWGYTNPEHLVYDSYPFLVNNGFLESYYYNLEVVRRQAKTISKDFWTFLQSVGLPWLREPSENDMRYNVYTNLAYGAKGIMYFTYWTPIYEGFYGSLILPDGSKNDTYYYAQNLNKEVLHLGPTLNRLTSEDVYHTGDLPRETTALPNDFFWQVTDTTLPAVIGSFHDENGNKYVMVVNRDTEQARRLSFKLPSKPESVLEISKETGNETSTNYDPDTGELSAQFAPGEGRLYKTSLISNLNELPIARSLIIEGSTRTSISGTLNAIDPDQDAIIYSIEDEAANGAVTITDSRTGSFTYVPNDGFSGTDTFTYKVNDGQSDSNIATVSITISSSLTGTAKVAAGTTVGTTRLLSDVGSGNHLAVRLSPNPIAAPFAGDPVPMGAEVINPYVSGADLAGVAAGMYAGVYEVDASNKIVGFTLLHLKKEHILSSYDYHLQNKFPIGVANGPEPEQATSAKYTEISAMNANFIIDSNKNGVIADTDSALELAEANGLKMMIDAENFAGSDRPSDDELDAWTNHFKVNSALLGYNLYQHPNSHLYSSLIAADTRLKLNDPSHLTYVNLAGVGNYSFGSNGGFITPATPIGQMIHTKKGQTEINTVTLSAGVSTNPWSTPILTLWDSPAKLVKIDSARINDRPNTSFPTFTFNNAHVHENTNYYVEMTVTGEYEGLMWVNYQLNPNGTATNNGVPVYGDYFYTINGETQIYEGYVQAWAETNPSILSFDQNPFRMDGSLDQNYYTNLELFRAEAVRRDVPLWSQIQSAGWNGVTKAPSQSELTYQLYTNLAYGVKGIVYSSYETKTAAGFNDGLILPDGTPNQSYYWAQQLNAEVLNIGTTLSKLKSEAVYHTGTLPSGTQPLPASFFWQPQDASAPLIISSFKDKQDRSYVMVVNRDTQNSLATSFKITSLPTSVNEVSKNSGAEEITNYDSNTGILSGVFAPGEGKLYALDNTVNHAPVASDISLATHTKTAVSGMLSAADSDLDALTYSIVSHGTKGVAFITNPVSGAFTYIPDAGASGVDTLTYRVFDGKNYSDIATVTINVIPAVPGIPGGASLVPADASGTTSVSAVAGAGNHLVLQLSSSRIASPYTDEPVPTGAGIIDDYTSGTVIPVAHEGMYVGVYVVNAANQVLGFQQLKVTRHSLMNQAPSATNVSLTTLLNTSVNGALFATDSDLDPLTYSIVSQGTKGVALITDQATGAFKYTPNSGVTGTDTFTYRAFDGKNYSNIATVTVKIILESTNVTVPGGPVQAETYASADGKLQLPSGKEGKVSLNDSIFIVIPAGTTSSDMLWSVAQVSHPEALNNNSAQLVSSIFEITASKTGNIKQPFIITFKIDPQRATADRTAAVYYYDSLKHVWVKLGGQVEGDQISVAANKPGQYAVFSETTDEQAMFQDTAKHWAETGIKQAVALGIVKGYPDGTFKPDRAVTRAEFVVMLLKALKLDVPETTTLFTDLDTIGSWGKEALLQAVQAGIVAGYSDNTLRPNAVISRTEMVVMAARALKLKLENIDSTDFADDGDIPEWGRAAVAAAKEQGLVQGQTNNKFNPDAATTRAEALTLILRLLMSN